ncbi:hypothetical protein J008_06461 [Cryptococcus neoformans]|nr:hypothetical protein J008_06461 [Cryptococcus neoformans var. grubii]
MENSRPLPLRPQCRRDPSSHANSREGRRNWPQSGNRSGETTAKVWAKSTKGWMLRSLVDVAMFSASLGLSLAAALVKPHQLALFITPPPSDVANDPLAAMRRENLGLACSAH